MKQPPNKLPDIAVWRAKIDLRGSYQLECVDLRPAPQSLNEGSQRLPKGVYTTFRTFDGDKILSLADQVERLEESAGLMGYAIQISIQPLREMLHKLVHQYPSQEKRVRISMDLTADVVYVLIESLQIPGKSKYDLGVRLATVPHERQNPKAKRTQFIEIAESIRRKFPGDLDDLLMVDAGGFILEGLNSNFFAIQHAEVFTAGDDVLAGITRKIVLNVIRQLGIPYHLSPIHMTDLQNLEEAFLTSASRSVLPVAQIDQFKVGSSMPGPITNAIQQAYWKYVASRLEQL
jgi:branched-chain amino acid aminotransferase